ncbi:MAG: hypothetical protein JW942_05715 [Opitutales bacterium]|nr:hypothetical protein [Opitutales bacterium]
MKKEMKKLLYAFALVVLSNAYAIVGASGGVDELDRLVDLLDSGVIVLGSNSSMIPLVKESWISQCEIDGCKFQHVVFRREHEFEVFMYVWEENDSWSVFCAGKRDLKNWTERYYFCDVNLLGQYIVAKTKVVNGPVH